MAEGTRLAERRVFHTDLLDRISMRLVAEWSARNLGAGFEMRATAGRRPSLAVRAMPRGALLGSVHWSGAQVTVRDMAGGGRSYRFSSMRQALSFLDGVLAPHLLPRAAAIARGAG